MGNNRVTTIEPMNKKQFLEFFRDECENAFINHVIEQDIFVYSMVRILLRALLNLHGGHSLPTYNEFNTEEYYERFNREEYIKKLCEELNYKSVEDFKGRIPSEKHKRSEFLKFKGMEYMCGAFQNVLPLVGVAADALYPGAGTGQAINTWCFQNIAPTAMGHSFSEIAQEAADKMNKKKDKKKRIAGILDIEDLASNVITISDNYAIGKAAITTAANAVESANYFMKMFKQKKKEDIAESNRIVKDLRHKFIRQNKLNRNRYQTDKKTVFSMLLFAYKHALDYLIEI